MIGRPRQQSWIPIFIVAVISVLLVTVGLASQQPVGQGPLSFITSPIQQAFSGVGRFLNGLVTTASAQQLNQQVQELQGELDTLRIENVSLREYQAEVVEYRRLLNFARENPTLGIVGADVIGIGNSQCKNQPKTGREAGICANVIADDTVIYARYVTINVGKRDGVREGMPVVGGAFALIGRVAEVSDVSAQVQLIVDSNSFVNVQLIGSRATGTVSGADDGTLRLQNVLQTEKIFPGDLIITSGLTGKMPRLLTIGQVDKIVSKDSDVLQEAIVRPAIDFNRLQQVLVLTGSTDIEISNSTAVTPSFILSQTNPITVTLNLSETNEISPTNPTEIIPITPP